MLQFGSSRHPRRGQLPTGNEGRGVVSLEALVGEELTWLFDFDEDDGVGDEALFGHAHAQVKMAPLDAHQIDGVQPPNTAVECAGCLFVCIARVCDHVKVVEVQNARKEKDGHVFAQRPGPG